jgi:hypothetical protein
LLLLCCPSFVFWLFFWDWHAILNR